MNMSLNIIAVMAIIKTIAKWIYGSQAGTPVTV